MLRVEKLCFSNGKTRVLDNVSFSVARGELCGLFGPNGCGKTTLFQCCMKFLAFADGAVFIGNRDLRAIGIQEIARMVAYVPQEHSPPFPYLAKEVVLMGRTPHLKNFRGICSHDKEKTRKAFIMLDIEHLADRPYNQLSSGQRQMVLIARALAQDTKIMFLDEPTSALDYRNQMRIWRVMRKIVENGTTVFVCSHDPNHVAWFCDKIIAMQKGRVAAEGIPDNVMNQDLLDSIYQDICEVRRTGAIDLILPREVAEHTALKKKGCAGLKAIDRRN